MPFEIRGMEATIAQFKQLAAGSEEAAKRAVKAGAKVLAQRLQEKAPVDMGELRDSIKRVLRRGSFAAGVSAMTGTVTRESTIMTAISIARNFFMRESPSKEL